MGCVRETNCRYSKRMLLAGVTARARLNFLRPRSFSPFGPGDKSMKFKTDPAGGRWVRNVRRNTTAAISIRMISSRSAVGSTDVHGFTGHRAVPASVRGGSLAAKWMWKQLSLRHPLQPEPPSLLRLSISQKTWNYARIRVCGLVARPDGSGIWNQSISTSLSREVSTASCPAKVENRVRPGITSSTFSKIADSPNVCPRPLVRVDHISRRWKKPCHSDENYSNWIEVYLYFACKTRTRFLRSSWIRAFREAIKSQILDASSIHEEIFHVRIRCNALRFRDFDAGIGNEDFSIFWMSFILIDNVFTEMRYNALCSFSTFRFDSF